jgi:hypothetical protein
MSLSYTEMKMNVDPKSDSSRGIGVDMFNHSNDEDEDNDDEDEDDEEEEEEEEEEGDDEDNDKEDEDDDEDDDDDGDNEDEEDEVENGAHNSNGCHILDVTPRDLQINHNSSTLHDMSRIHWPPGSWQDGTRRSAFQPYRVGSMVDIDNKIKKGPICFQFINFEITQTMNIVDYHTADIGIWCTPMFSETKHVSGVIFIILQCMLNDPVLSAVAFVCCKFVIYIIPYYS